MRLFDMITTEENEMIDYYRMTFAEGRRDPNTYAESKAFLSAWEAAKGNNSLIDSIFKDSLTISKMIEAEKPIEEIRRELVTSILSPAAPPNFYSLMSKGLNLLTDEMVKEIVIPDAERPYSHLSALWISLCDPLDFATNRYNGPVSKVVFKNGLIFKFHKGTRILKLLKSFCDKMAESPYDVQGYFKAALEEYESFRVAHSKILNERIFSGKLTLSIHPLDYFTLSDNNSSWSSCMSWNDNGEFRLGTIDMMNSPYAIVAYLESNSKNFYLDAGNNNYKWSNKKWRELILVHPEMITGVKGYPYHNLKLEEISLNFVNELCGNRYTRKGTFTASEECIDFGGGISTPFSFHTDIMYNDLSPEVTFIQTINVLTTEAYYENPTINSLNFSGSVTCIWCGDVIDPYYAESSYLVCDYCTAYAQCQDCGRLIYSPTVTNRILGLTEGEAYCYDCQKNLPVDLASGRPMSSNADYLRVYVLRDEAAPYKLKPDSISFEAMKIKSGRLYLQNTSKTILKDALWALSFESEVKTPELMERVEVDENEAYLVLYENEISETLLLVDGYWKH